MTKDQLAEYVEQSASATPRLSVPIDLPNLLRTGRAAFKVDRMLEKDVGYLDEEDDGRFDEEDEPVEGCRRAAVKNDFAYLREVSLTPFITPTEGTVVQDLLEDGAVKKIIINEGQGPIVPDNCKVFVHYVCATETGVVFDSTLTVERCRPAGIDLREANVNVLPGIYLALKSMRKFMIRYDQAFGELGCPPRIPPMTDVACNIELLSIVDEEKLKTIKYMTTEERNALTFSEIFDHASEKKREENTLYSRNSFGRAVKMYYEGINVLEDYPVFVQEEHDKRQETLFALYNNLTQCFLKLEKWPQACVACKKGLTSIKEGDPSASKLFYRFAIAKRQLGHPTHALDLINKALTRDPNNKSIKLEKNTILQCIKDEKETSKRLMARMGGGGFSGQTNSVEPKTCDGSDDKRKNCEQQNSGQFGKKVEDVKDCADKNVKQETEDTTEAFDQLTLSK